LVLTGSDQKSQTFARNSMLLRECGHALS